ncbi:SLATT domain-containing protein [Streptomyces sp. Ncost-T6T-1]|uniref:SLATT domain-containing protein n=1 Tax=Streptomyces sp. Ncost-T6T-1 TaxID=1100828 RepID=UPI000D1B2C02|nr:SLATT domain-containing protein [Streptomyces sp. Ncost-T6T-1]
MPQSTSPAERAVEELLQHDKKILELRYEIRRARLRRFILVSTYSSAPTLLLLLFLGNIATWGHVDLARINIAGIPVLITLLILCPVVRYFSCGEVFDGNVIAKWEPDYGIKKKIELELAIEKKRLSAASIDLSTETRRHIYRETTPAAIERYRTSGLRYRRVHNAFQSVIIIGSLTTSTAASLAETPAPYKWITVGTSFSVGLAAGFTGYFKFRERSFYLQQTADAIEEEYDAVNLKVGRYKGSTDDAAALLEFTERVETLKNDQRKRQQQLDQPTETPEG